MITMRIKGGLGNQLFQYATAYSLAKRLGQPFQFDFALSNNMTERDYRFSALNVECDALIQENELPKKIKILKNRYVNKFCRIMNFSKQKCGSYLYWLETRDVFQPEFFEVNKDNLYIDGYFQSEIYFKKYREELCKQFTPRYEPEEHYLKLLSEIKNSNSVAVHVRRNDFKNDKHPFHYLISETYYKQAINYMRENQKNPSFFWFSDDMSWVKKYIGNSNDFRFVCLETKNNDIDDLMLMKNCKHIITANSTFSWWAAWLNEYEDAIRVVPSKPYGMEGMIPENWIKI